MCEVVSLPKQMTYDRYRPAKEFCFASGFVYRCLNPPSNRLCPANNAGLQKQFQSALRAAPGLFRFAYHFVVHP